MNGGGGKMVRVRVYVNKGGGECICVQTKTFLLLATTRGDPQTDRVKPPRVLLAFQHYHPAYHEGAARFARKAGWTLDSFTAQSGELRTGVHYDGILSHAIGKGRVRDYVEASDIPTVDITGTLHRRGVPRVMHHYEAIAAIAAGHFISRGWKDAAFYISRPLARCRDDREPLYWPTFQHLLQADGRNAHLLEWRNPQGRIRNEASARFRWLSRTLRRLPRPLAVWAWDDFSAVELLDACADANLFVPRDVAVMGTHNEPLICEFAHPPLSSLDSRRIHHSFTACELLARLMKGDSTVPGLTRIDPGGVVERQSTGVSDQNLPEGLVRAIQHIRNHFRQELRMDDVARRAGLSLRLMQIQFRRETGQSPTELQTECRLEHARKLLLQSAMPVGEIAEACGFASASAFTQFFTRLNGAPPRAFRERRRTS